MHIEPEPAPSVSQPLAFGLSPRSRGGVLPLLIALCPAVANAQLPLSIDALLIPESTFTISAQTQWQQSRQPVLAGRETPSGAVLLSLGQGNAEQGVTAIGARYGVAPRVEVNGRLTHRHTRWRNPGAPAWQADGYGADVGVSWLALPERGAPAVLLDMRADLMSQPAFPGAQQQWLDGFEFGVTGYRSIDPVVLSLSARYRYQEHPDNAAPNVTGAHNLLLAPQVNFAVNASVTLVGGLSLRYRDVNTDPSVGNEHSVATALRLGLGYAAGRHSTFFLNANIATSGSDAGAGFDLEWLYRFQ